MSSTQGLPLSQVGEESQAGEGRAAWVERSGVIGERDQVGREERLVGER